MVYVLLVTCATCPAFERMAGASIAAMLFGRCAWAPPKQNGRRASDSCELHPAKQPVKPKRSSGGFRL